MFKRKQLQDQQELERRELGLEREDFECSSDSDTDLDEGLSGAEMVEDEDELLEDEESEPNSGPNKTKVMILGSRGINSRYFFIYIIKRNNLIDLF